MNVTLLILLFVSHYVCDFTHLSTTEMLAAKKYGTPLKPIADHAILHACISGIIITLYFYFIGHKISVDVWMVVFVLQAVSHFAIDVLKGKCNVWFPQVANPANKSHWYIFGFDQLLHQIVIILMWWIVTKT